jgi:CBS domain-containing membrane protein
MPEGAAPTKIEPTTLASALMRRNVVFAKLDTSITTTGQVMLANKLPCIPVVLDDMTLVGIVTEADFVRLALEFLSMKIQLVR